MKFLIVFTLALAGCLAQCPNKASQPLELSSGLVGRRYHVGSGNIRILNKKTIEIPSFTFDGDKPPDAWFFAGKYDGEQVNVETGKKLIIKGISTQPALIPAEKFTGDKTITVELPSGLSVCDIEYLAVQCIKYNVDFGDIDLRNKVNCCDVPDN